MSICYYGFAACLLLQTKDIQFMNKQSQITIEESIESEDRFKMNDQGVSKKKERLLSLDAYRGLTMLGMIYADHVGSFNQAPWWMVHQRWNGFTLADMVFPSFLFIMGLSIPLAVSKNRPIQIKNIMRVLLLFLIGLILNFIGDFDLSILRIPGILQRMSICYGIVIFWHWFSQYGTNNKKLIISIAFMVGLVIAYHPLMLTWENTQIDCYTTDKLDPYCNFAGYVDRSIFSPSHILEQTDPQGVISTMTASFSTFFGYLMGLTLMKFKKEEEKLIKIWTVVGAICLVLVYPSKLLMPLNKRLYTLSFLFATLAASISILTLFLIVIDYIPKYSSKAKTVVGKIIRPLQWLGMNPLAIFILLQLTFALMDGWFESDGQSPFRLLFRVCFSWMNQKLATVIYATVYAIYYILVAWLMQKFNIFLRL